MSEPWVAIKFGPFEVGLLNVVFQSFQEPLLSLENDGSMALKDGYWTREFGTAVVLPPGVMTSMSADNVLLVGTCSRV